MGSGKTTVGRLLAHALAWRFADLDEEVAIRERCTVPQIFAERGEEAFRRAETKALAMLLEEAAIVIALGGGAAGTPANRDLLQHSRATIVVHLDAPFPILYARCATQALDPAATARPLLGDREAAEARYRDRSDVYAALAHRRVDSEEVPERVVGAILTMLRSQPESVR